MVKNITGSPCPSCGTTRAIQLLLNNDWMASLQMNPFGILVALMMFGFLFGLYLIYFLRKNLIINTTKKLNA